MRPSVPQYLQRGPARKPTQKNMRVHINAIRNGIAP